MTNLRFVGRIIINFHFLLPVDLHSLPFVYVFDITKGDGKQTMVSSPIVFLRCKQAIDKRLLSLSLLA